MLKLVRRSENDYFYDRPPYNETDLSYRRSCVGVMPFGYNQGFDIVNFPLSSTVGLLTPPLASYLTYLILVYILYLENIWFPLIFDYLTFFVLLLAIY